MSLKRCSEGKKQLIDPSWGWLRGVLQRSWGSWVAAAGCEPGVCKGGLELPTEAWL